MLFLFLFATFSGVSITLVIPIFDFIFINDRSVEPSYQTFGSFWDAMTSVLHSAFHSENAGDSLAAQLSTLWTQTKSVLELTDQWLLLKTICGLLIVLFLCKNLFFYMHRLMFVNLCGKTVKDLRDACYKKYLSQSYSFFSHFRVGDSIVRMINDIDIVNNLFIENIFKIVRDCLVISIYAFIALKLNAHLFLVSLFVLPPFIITVNVLANKIKKYSKKIQAQLSDMFSSIEEVLNSMRIVKAFSKEKYEGKKLTGINLTHFRFWRRSQVYRAFGVPIAEMSSLMIGVTLLLIGGHDIIYDGDNFTFGDFTAFLFAVFSMLHPLKSLVNDFNDLKRAVVSIERVNEILSLESEITENKNPIEKKEFLSSIEFANVSFQYLGESNSDNNNKCVLKDINLKILKGQKVAFVGSSGCGKTTLINLMNRMYDVSAGTVLIDGENIKSIRISDLRYLFGIVTQESILFSDTIKNNINYGAKEPRHLDDVKTACQTAFADEFIEKLPDKYDTIVLAKGSNLSGGQKQRLCIARAIIDNPPILIFDEATSALDTHSEQKVQKAIDAAVGDRTVIIIAHRLSTILSADIIYVLEHGEIVGAGKHETLINDCPHYRHFYELQSRDSTTTQ
jgi:subfamily B ATP-binding cassette protein MsbA